MSLFLFLISQASNIHFKFRIKRHSIHMQMKHLILMSSSHHRRMALTEKKWMKPQKWDDNTQIEKKTKIEKNLHRNTILRVPSRYTSMMMVWIHIALFCNCYIIVVIIIIVIIYFVMDSRRHSKHKHLLLLSRTVYVFILTERFGVDRLLAYSLTHSLTRSLNPFQNTKWQNKNEKRNIYRKFIPKTIDTYRCVCFRCEW